MTITKKTVKSLEKRKISYIKEVADQLFSKIIRHRDKKCLMCGSDYSLQAHHCLHTKAASSKYRYDPRNLLTLCHCCHRVVQDDMKGTLHIISRLLRRYGIATKEEVKEILTDRSQTVQNKFELIDFIGELRKRIKEFKI